MSEVTSRTEGITEEDLKALEALQRWLDCRRAIGGIQDRGTAGLYLHINLKYYADMLGIKDEEDDDK